MPSEIIKKLTEAENRAEEREKEARIEAKAIISDAKLRAEEIIKKAESECEEMLLSSEEEACCRVENLKKESNLQLEDKIQALKKSAEKNFELILQEVIKALA